MEAINARQRETLSSLVTSGKVNIVDSGLDLRTLQALGRRGFVSLTENSKGSFAMATAKGKKELN